jgi:hypothetical protein
MPLPAQVRSIGDKGQDDRNRADRDDVPPFTAIQEFLSRRGGRFLPLSVKAISIPSEFERLHAEHEAQRVETLYGVEATSGNVEP